MIGRFNLDIEKFYRELDSQGKQLKGLMCIQYPIFCIHSEILDSTPDELSNLDSLIVKFLIREGAYSSELIASFIGASKRLVEFRIDKLLRENLLVKKEGKLSLSKEGDEVFERKSQIRQQKFSYDFFVDGITLMPLPKQFYQYYRSKYLDENDIYISTNKKTGESYPIKPFAPDIIHTPPNRNLIIENILNLDIELRENFYIPKGLNSIEDISFTKMSIPILIALSKAENGVHKELIDGFAIFSLSDGSTYYQAVRKNVMLFEKVIGEKIKNIEFRIEKKVGKDDDNVKYHLMSNWNEIDRNKGITNRCFNFSSEDLTEYIRQDFQIKNIPEQNIMNDDDNIEISITKETLLASQDRKTLIGDLIRKRNYKLYHNSLDRNVFLFPLYYNTEDEYVEKVITFTIALNDYSIGDLSLQQFLQEHPDYKENYREYLKVAGQFELLEKFDIEKYMLSLG